MHHMTITLMDHLPVLLNTIEADFSIKDDWPWAVKQWHHFLDDSPVPLFAIDDVRKMNVALGDVVAFASLGTRGPDPIWRHPNLRCVCFITDSALIRAAVAGLNSPTFGNTAAKAFPTVEYALVDIEQALAAEVC